MISIDEFARMKLVVGTVTEVSDHPNADKLIVLKVDIGGESRQLVAGLKGHYDGDELSGRQIVLVANLEPASLRGVESQGMLLAAVDADRVVVLEPSEPVAPGSTVR